MLGLKYTGVREEGVRVLFYRSYKTVLLRRNSPYTFTDSDDTSKEAENYYRKLRKLGVEITNNPNDLKIKPKKVSQDKRVQKLDAEIGSFNETDKVNLNSSESIYETKSEVGQSSSVLEYNLTRYPDINGVGSSSVESPTDDQYEESTESLVTDGSEDDSDYDNYSNEELLEYLDMNLGRDQIKSLIETLNLDIPVGKRSKSTLMNNIVDSYRNELVEYLKGLKS